MRKLTAVTVIMAMALSLMACGGKKEETQEMTLANSLKEDFVREAEKNPEAACVDMATAMRNNERITFAPVVMEVEEGMLTGFGNYSVEGFTDAAALAPMIGTIPFICYIFTLPEGEDAKAFAGKLTENCDLNWNICTTADEAVTETVGNKVFFAMGPYSMEEEAEEEPGAEIVYQ